MIDDFDFAFFANEEWYDIDYEKSEFVLTEKAPEEVRESYEEYIKMMEHARKNHIFY